MAAAQGIEMKGAKRKGPQYALKDLENGATIPSRVWRDMREKGKPTVTADVLCGTVNVHSMHSAIYRLTEQGWVVKVGMRGKEALYEALTAARRREPVPPSPRCMAKQRLTWCAKKAGEARRTGLARDMAQALFELEKVIREIRESL